MSEHYKKIVKKFEKSIIPEEKEKIFKIVDSFKDFFKTEEFTNLMEDEKVYYYGYKK